ncbi:MAG: hypothetical protein K2K18_02340 [Malacoplasma sp.]|nr:hypothetical protein [Malacoplasma sp.]
MKIDLSNKAFEKNNDLNTSEKNLNRYENITIKSNLKKPKENKLSTFSFFGHKRFVPFLISNIVLVFTLILLFVLYSFIVNNNIEIIQISSVIACVMSFIVLVTIGIDLFFYLNKSDLEIEDGLNKTKYSTSRILTIVTFIAIFFTFIFTFSCLISVFVFDENIKSNFLDGMKITLSIFCWFSIIFTITSIATNITSFVLKD